jgi:D-arabinose 1-dehydrogenase-like Zn-dependent alcohol dehydrogenase
VVVIGTGGIGMYCLMVAKAAGAGRLVAVDVSDYALETAQSWAPLTPSIRKSVTPRPPFKTYFPRDRISQIHTAIETMSSPQRNKVIINP